MTRQHPERAEQRAIVQLLTHLGAKVWQLGTTRRHGDYQGTMQTPGLADLQAFLPTRGAFTGPWRLLVIEVKAPGGRLRPEQAVYRACCVGAGVAHVVGGVDRSSNGCEPRAT